MRILGIVALLALTCAPVWAQSPPKLYQVSPLEGDANREVRMQAVTIAPGGGNNFHRHPGDQWAMVQEGEVTFTIKGQPPRVLKVGDSVYIPRGTIHRNQNFGAVASRSVELLIVDKGKPTTEQVPD
jgi:quercetin dioxygenase-like cupin family protein